MCTKNKGFSKRVVLAALLAFVLATFTYSVAAAQVNKCNGVDGAYGYVYNFETHVSTCYSSDGIGQWKSEGFVIGSLTTTLWSHILQATN
jgi:hypothetical protein